MEIIYYNNDEYTKLYEHEGGGIYFVSETSNVTSWLDVYPDGTVKYLWNGTLHDLGRLEGNTVIETK